MACPYFYPQDRLPWSAWPGKLRPPLGEIYRGECRACEQPFAPTQPVLVECCNLGYAAKECNRFPRGEGPEAVRFSLSSDDGQLVSISYVIEKAHLPFRHGVLRYCRKTDTWDGLDGDSLLSRQAEAYLHSYLRSKSERQARGSKTAQAAEASASGL